MDLNGALQACQSGAFIRDEGGTMKPGWKIKYVKNEIGSIYGKGIYVYVNPKGDDAHRIIFNDAHRASWQWRIVPSEYPTEKDLINVRPH